MRLAVALGMLVMAAPAHAAPVSAHAMVHTCCTPAAEKDRIFSEAKQLGSAYIRVDVEMNAIFEGPDGSKRATPNWAGLDDDIRLSKKYDVPVLGILLAPPRFTSACPKRLPDSSHCAAADTREFGALAGEIAEHAAGAVRHWEIVNEPDGSWAFDGTPEQYAAMLSAAHDGIKAKVPDAKVVLGGLMRPHEPGWLQRVFDTPGADARHKFDIANIHLRGSVDAVVSRYVAFRSWLAERRFDGPLWITELGYSADPAFQTDRAYRAGEPSQAAYLTQTLVGLGEVGAPQVFVTLRDEGEGKYASEGLEHIDETPGGDYPVTRRASFAAVRRVVDEWDELMAWRREQRDSERERRLEQAKEASSAASAKAARGQLREARLLVQSAPPGERLARARALLAGRRVLVLFHTGLAHWHAHEAYEHGVAAAALKKKIAGG